MNCKYCNKEYEAKNALIQHEIRCKMNPDRISVKHTDKTKNKIREIMKTKDTRNVKIWTDEMRKSASKTSKLINKLYWTDEMREKQSKRMKKAVMDNPDSYSKNNVSGRVKMYEYNGFTLKGKWELLVAQRLDECGIKWTNIITPIPYFWNNNWHMYFPDFYLEESDALIEVKGYETERDVAKWDSVKLPLIILKHSEIKELKNNSTSIKKYIAGSTSEPKVS